MQYFMMTTAETHGGVNSGVVDAQGNLIDWDTVVNPEERYLAYWNEADERLGDVLHADSNPIVISNRAFIVIRRFRMPPGTMFAPVHVIDDVDGKEMDIAMMIHFRQVYDVMTTEAAAAYNRQSFIDRIEGTAASPVLSAELLQGFDLLDALHVGTPCSQDLKDAMEENRITNVRFLPTIVE